MGAIERRRFITGAAIAAGAGCSTKPRSEAPVFDAAFWKTWGDGQAELAGYDLVFPRYGQARRGVAVTIFVTEPFSESLRVKADEGKHPASDVFPVMKLNLVKDYQTGVYDYNQMTSSFVSLAGRSKLAAGSVTKISFSCQEWCGHVWQQAIAGPESLRLVSHSYFDGEADRDEPLLKPATAFFEDQLLHWARGMAWPVLGAGQSSEAHWMMSMESSRLQHRRPVWAKAVLTREASPETVSADGKTYECDVFAARIEGGGERRVWVETGGERRVVRWTSSSGESAVLIGSERMKYWELNREGGEARLQALGLKPRAARMV